MITLSVIKADTGGYVGHTAVHPAMIVEAGAAIRAAVGTEVQLAFMGEERRPKTWADRKALIDKMAEKLTNGS